MTSIESPVSHPDVDTKGVPPAASGRAIVVCDQWLGSDGYGGMKALRRAEWDVHVIPEWEFVPVKWRSFHMKVIGKSIRSLAVREYNRELLLQAQRLRPDMLLVFKGTWILGDTIRTIRDLGARCYCFYPDVSFRSHGPYLPEALPRYDWIFSTKSFGMRDMREQLGIAQTSRIDFAFDPDLHRPLSLTAEDMKRYTCDVSYVGKWSPKKEMLLGALVGQRPQLKVRVWGEAWDRARDPLLRAAIGGREVLGNEFVKALVGSDINLSIMSEAGKGASLGDQVASRTFVVPATGAFVLHERTEELMNFFTEDVHLACFDGAEEMLEKIDTYLAAPERRRVVAEQGKELVWREHSWDRRIRIITEHFARDAPQLKEAGEE
jgi:spore maturation protein CgeB